MPANSKHIPTEATRAQVTALAIAGVPQDRIGEIVGVTKPTLRKYYREELDHGSDKANAKIASTLYQQAIDGSVAALIFWAKTRMGWRETNRTELTGADGGAIQFEDEGQKQRLREMVNDITTRQIDETAEVADKAHEAIPD